MQTLVPFMYAPLVAQYMLNNLRDACFPPYIWTEWQTGVKTLPYRNEPLGGGVSATPPVDTPLGRYPLGRHPPGQTSPGQTLTWADTPLLCSACEDTVNKRAVRVLLECILVYILLQFSEKVMPNNRLAGWLPTVGNPGSATDLCTALICTGKWGLILHRHHWRNGSNIILF